MKTKPCTHIRSALRLASFLAGTAAIAATAPTANVNGAANGAAAASAGAVNGAVGGAVGGNAAAVNAQAGLNGGAGPNAASGSVETVDTWQDRYQHQDRATNDASVKESISGAKFESRTQLDTQVRGYLAAGDRAMRDAQHDADKLNDDAKTAFKAASDDAERAEEQFKADLKAAGEATADTWEHCRAQLAADHAAYVSASDRAHAVAEAKAGVTTDGSSGM